MYKTVRQGENSLQYTILPQSEEVFTNSGVKGKGRDYSPSNQAAKRAHRKLNAIHFTFLFISGILTIAATLLILKHFGIATNFLPKSFTGGIINFASPNKSVPISTTTAPPKQSTLSSILTSLRPIKDDNVLKTSQPTFTPKEPAQVVLSKTSVSPRRESNNDLMLGHDQINWTDYQDEDDDDDDYDINKSVTKPVDSKKAPTKVTTLPTTVLPSSTVISTSSSTAKAVKKADTTDEKDKNRTNMLSETKEHNILDDNDEDFKEFNNDSVEDVTESKKDDIKMSQTKSSWLQNKWPFVDPSSYFQWTDYNARDNLLLPAILSAVLSALFVLAILCYAMRRRQRCKRRIQEIGNLTSELQAEDNAILLTAENASEEE